MSEKNPTLDYASSGETQAPDREGSSRYYRERPDVLWLAVAFILFVVLTTLLVYARTFWF